MENAIWNDFYDNQTQSFSEDKKMILESEGISADCTSTTTSKQDDLDEYDEDRDAESSDFETLSLQGRRHFSSKRKKRRKVTLI